MPLKIKILDGFRTASLSFLLLAALAPMSEANQAAFQKHLQALADSAETIPPELASDSLIRIAGLVVTSKDKRSLLERAFQLAESAKYEVNLIASVDQAFDTDSDPGLIQSALEAGLDRLTLQCRIVERMLSIDPSRARELLLEIRSPSFSRLTCKSALRPSPQILYENVAHVMRSGFTEQQRRAGKPLELAQYFLLRISSATELLPALRMIDSGNVADEDFATLISAFESALSQMTADDGTFGAVAKPAFFSELDKALALCRTSHMSVEALVAAFRTYLNRNMQYASCADRVPESKLLVDHFETLRQTEAPRVPQLEFLMQARPLVERAEVVLWWTSPLDAPILLGLRQLTRAIRDSQIPSQSIVGNISASSRKPLNAWDPQMKDFLQKLDLWQGDHADSQFTYFFQYCFAYQALIDMSPSGSVQNGIIEAYVELLSNSSNEFDDPPAWALLARRLIQQRKTKPAILRAIRERGDSLLHFLTEIEDLSPNRPTP